MLYAHPKTEKELDLMDVMGRQGWNIEEMCSFNFDCALPPLQRKMPRIVRYARSFISGDRHPYVGCFLDDEESVFTLQLIQQRTYRTAMPTRRGLYLVNRKNGLLIPLGGLDWRKIQDDRQAYCPRAGRVFTRLAYEKVMSIDPCAFQRALGYIIPEGTPV